MANSAASEMILRVKNWNPEEVTFGAARQTKAGGKSIPILQDGKKIVLQFSKHSTYGLVGMTPPNEPDGARKYSVNLKLSNGTPLCEKLKQLETMVVNHITAHGGELLGQAGQPEAVIRALSYPIVKYPKDKDTGKIFYDRDPTTKLKVSYWEGVWRLELFDSEGKTLFEPKMMTPLVPEDPDSEMVPVNPTEPELAPSGTEMVGLMQCDGIWIASGRFGVTWRLLQAQLKQPVRISGFCIQPESDDEDAGETNEAETTSGADTAAATVVQENANEDADEDANENANEDANEEVEPAPKPKAKRARKTKQ